MTIVHSTGADTSCGLPQCHCSVLLSLQQKRGGDGAMQSSRALGVRQAIPGHFGALGNKKQTSFPPTFRMVAVSTYCQALKRSEILQG